MDAQKSSISELHIHLHDAFESDAAEPFLGRPQSDTDSSNLLRKPQAKADDKEKLGGAFQLTPYLV